MTDEELLEELRHAVADRDPAPPTLQAAARDAFGLGRLTDELAELIGDSDLEPAGARGAEHARLLSFRATDLEADVQVVGRAGGFDVTGVVSGSVSAVSLQTPDAVHDLPLDDQGRFRRAGLAGRMLRLALRGPSGRTAATAWVLLD